MNPTSRDITFVIRLRNEARAALQQLNQDFRGTGSNVRSAAQETRQHAQALDQLTNAVNRNAQAARNHAAQTRHTIIERGVGQAVNLTPFGRVGLGSGFSRFEKDAQGNRWAIGGAPGRWGMATPGGTSSLEKDLKELDKVSKSGSTRAFAKDAEKAAAGLSNMHLNAGSLTRELRALFDELASGRYRQAMSSLTLLFTRGLGFGFGPVAGVMAGAAAVGIPLYEAGRLSSSQAEFARQNQAYGGIVGPSVYANASQNVASSGGYTEPTANAAITNLAFGGVAPTNLSRAGGLVRDYAALTGNNASGAATSLAQALRDPYQGLKKLDDQYNIVSADTLELVKHLEEMGKTAEAQGIVIDALSKRFAGMADQLPAWERAWDSFVSTLGSGLDNFVKWAARLSGHSMDTLPEKIARDQSSLSGFDNLLAHPEQWSFGQNRDSLLKQRAQAASQLQSDQATLAAQNKAAADAKTKLDQQAAGKEVDALLQGPLGTVDDTKAAIQRQIDKFSGPDYANAKGVQDVLGSLRHQLQTTMSPDEINAARAAAIRRSATMSPDARRRYMASFDAQMSGNGKLLPNGSWSTTGPSAANLSDAQAYAAAISGSQQGVFGAQLGADQSNILGYYAANGASPLDLEQQRRRARIVAQYRNRAHSMTIPSYLQPYMQQQITYSDQSATNDQYIQAAATTREQAQQLDMMQAQMADLMAKGQGGTKYGGQLTNVQRVQIQQRLGSTFSSDQVGTAKYNQTMTTWVQQAQQIDAVSKSLKDATQAQNEFESASKAFGSTLSSNIVGLVNRTTTLKSALYSVVSLIENDLANALIAKPISEGINSLLSPNSANGQLAGGGGGGLGEAAGIVGLLGRGLNLFGGIFHSGGVVGDGIGPTRAVDPAVFLGARRYHDGGIASDEVPAILQRGEEVLTRNDPRHSANGGGTTAHYAPVINVNVGGGSRGPSDDKAMAQTISAHVDAALQQHFATFVQKQQRPGGMLNRNMYAN